MPYGDYIPEINSYSAALCFAIQILVAAGVALIVYITDKTNR